MIPLRRKPFFFWFLISIALLVLLTPAILPMLASAFGTAKAQNPPTPLSQVIPPPGQLVEIEGQKVHLFCSGSGPSTVILDAGMAEWSIHWSWVQPEVAKFARVCSLDRPGYGWSAPLRGAPSLQNTVELIERVLTQAGIRRDWVLVGHSLGGVHMRLLTERNLQRVRGLVLVDSPAQAPDPEEIKMVRKQLEGLKMVLGLAEKDMIRLGGKDSIPKPNLPSEWINAYYETLFRPEFYRTYIREAETVFAEPPAPQQSLGTIPVRILSAGRPQELFPPGLAQRLHGRWLEGQKTLLSLSSDAQQVVIDSDHMILLNQPRAVVQAIRGVLE